MRRWEDRGKRRWGEGGWIGKRKKGKNIRGEEGKRRRRKGKMRRWEYRGKRRRGEGEKGRRG